MLEDVCSTALNLPVVKSNAHECAACLVACCRPAIILGLIFGQVVRWQATTTERLKCKPALAPARTGPAARRPKIHCEIVAAMDDDFNFLRYLDFSTSSSSSLHQQQQQQQQPQPHSAASATFESHSNGSTASSYASPQDKSTGSSEWSVSSPSGSSASYTKSPLFGDINSIPSLFDSSFSWDAVNDINSSSSSNAASNVYNAPSSMASSYPPSNTSGNSPPFDLSIYGPSAATSNHDLANATNSSNTSFTANGSNVYGNMSVPDNVSC